MGGKTKRKLTRFEMDIMGALWEIGQASVREIQERLPKRDRPAYTTVQTIVRRLQEKGAVRQVKTIGNAFIFEAVITRKAAHRRLIDDLLEMFGGSARPLMAHLAEAGKLTLEDVRQIDEMLSEQEAKAERVVRPAPKAERQV
jgi:BlaI family transcriptional regulator, penicillinase repressor